MNKVVLIADIEPRCYSQVRRKLLADHYDVLQAASIEEAMEHLDLKTADLLLLDLDVPGDRIRRDLSRLAQLNPNLRIIGVTERSEGAEIAVHERLDGVAEKPFAAGNLISFVHELLTNPSDWKEFRYLAPMIPGLYERASHRPHHVFNYPAAYSRWGINE